ncbi:MAG TPA: hypothetical protein VNO30_41340 [Kofleriaceae bacterium]|nr:hypothetical protein [Kofleriaceae bacterium]
MAKLVTAETLVPRNLDPRARQQLEDDLYDLHSRIFRGVDRDAFVAYVIDSHAEHTWIQLYRSEDGALGGYAAVHIYERVIGGKTTAILRAETGTLREHRGAQLVINFYADRVIRYRAAHPLRPLYFLGSLVHPSSYALIARHVDCVWPCQDAETPPEILELLGALGDAFGLDRVDAANALVRKVGWQTIDSRDDRAYWERSEKPGVQFFLRANPGYVEGHGLLTLVPLSLGVCTRGLARVLRMKGERRARQLAARARARLAGLAPGPGATTAAA